MWRTGCSPSRGALAYGSFTLRSGLYGRTIRVYFPNEPGGLPDTEVTMAEALQQRGYRTGIFGKWHLGDAPHALPTRHGFDEWLGVPYSNDMDWVGEPGFEELVAMSMRGDTEGEHKPLRGALLNMLTPRVRLCGSAYQQSSATRRLQGLGRATHRTSEFD